MTETTRTRKQLSPAREAVIELLADGEWHDGYGIFLAAQRVIPPGPASRAGATERRDITDVPLEELIEGGRRFLARVAITSMITRGRLMVDVPLPLGRAAWSGELEWQVRDRLAGARMVMEAAEELGVPDHVLSHWVSRDYITATVFNGITYLMPADFERARKVRAHWRPNARFPMHPRCLWDPEYVAELTGGAGPPPPALVCPHCREPLQIEVSKG